jgi:hypothetical protein
MSKILVAGAVSAAVLVWSAAAAAQTSEERPAFLTPEQVNQLLDEETRRQHQRRVSAYDQLRGRLDSSIGASSEARNLAVGSALQMVTPLTDIKVQQMQQKQMLK